MAGQEYTRFSVDLDITKGSDILSASKYFGQFEKIIKTLSDDGLAFSSALRRGTQVLSKDFFIPQQQSANADKAFNQVPVDYITSTGGKGKDPFTITQSKTEMVEFQRKLMASKRELASIKAEIARYGGKVTESSREGYHTITVPDMTKNVGGQAVPFSDYISNRIKSSNERVRQSQAEALRERDSNTYNEYMAARRGVIQAQDSRMKQSKGMEEYDIDKEDPEDKINDVETLRKVQQSTGKFKLFKRKRLRKKYGTGEFALGDDEAITAGPEPKALDIDSKNYGKSTSFGGGRKPPEDDPMDPLDEFFGGKKRDVRKKDTSTSSEKGEGSIAQALSFGKLFMIIKLITMVIDILKKIFDAMSKMAEKAVQSAITGAPIGLAPIDVLRYSRAEQIRGLQEGTTVGAMRNIQQQFGNIQNIDKKATEGIALVLGEEVANFIGRSLRGGESPEKLLDTLISGYMERALAGKTSINAEATTPEQAFQELYQQLSGYNPEAASIFERKWTQSKNIADPGLADAARNKGFTDWMFYGGAAAAVNPMGINNQQLNELSGIQKILEEIKSLWEGMKDGIFTQLLIAFKGVIGSLRNAMRVGMSAEMLSLDYENARLDAKEKLEQTAQIDTALTQTASSALQNLRVAHPELSETELSDILRNLTLYKDDMAQFYQRAPESVVSNVIAARTKNKDFFTLAGAAIAPLEARSRLRQLGNRYRRESVSDTPQWIPENPLEEVQKYLLDASVTQASLDNKTSLDSAIVGIEGDAARIINDPARMAARRSYLRSVVSFRDNVIAPSVRAAVQGMPRNAASGNAYIQGLQEERASGAYLETLSRMFYNTESGNLSQSEKDRIAGVRFIAEPTAVTLQLVDDKGTPIGQANIIMNTTGITGSDIIDMKAVATDQTSAYQAPTGTIR